MPRNDPEYDKLYKRRLRNTKKFGRKPLPGAKDIYGYSSIKLMEMLKIYSKDAFISQNEGMRRILGVFLEKNISAQEFSHIKGENVKKFRFRIEASILEKIDNYILVNKITKSRLFEIALIDFFQNQ